MKASKIGQITVKIFRKGPTEIDKRHIPIEADTVTEIAEKAMKGKGLSHSTG